MCNTGSEEKRLSLNPGRGMGKEGNLILQVVKGGGNTTPCLSGQWEGWRAHFVPPRASFIIDEGGR